MKNVIIRLNLYKNQNSYYNFFTDAPRIRDITLTSKRCHIYIYDGYLWFSLFLNSATNYNS